MSSFLRCSRDSPCFSPSCSAFSRAWPARGLLPSTCRKVCQLPPAMAGAGFASFINFRECPPLEWLFHQLGRSAENHGNLPHLPLRPAIRAPETLASRPTRPSRQLPCRRGRTLIASNSSTLPWPRRNAAPLRGRGTNELGVTFVTFAAAWVPLQPRAVGRCPPIPSAPAARSPGAPRRPAPGASTSAR